MVEPVQSQIEKLRLSIKKLEEQRSELGDEVVNPALSALREKLAALEEQLAAQATPSEERRMVTILFFDIVGSTSLAEKLDPEEWRQVLSQVHAALGKATASHHGAVAQYLGDGLLAFFGSKQASEHDPEDAIRAALEGHSAVLNLGLVHKVQLRAGIHTGLVVVGELGDALHKEFTASGDAVNLAARLQSAAPPGGTLISHDTYRYVRGVFDLTPQPSLTVKGKLEPVQTYLVRRAKPRPFRSVSRGVAGIETRTIGRELEMSALQQAYQKAFEGHGLVWAQLLSEPGVGKSRLVADMTDWIDLHPETTWLLRARAFPDDANQPFALIRRMWFDRFQIAEDAPLPIAEAKWVERFKEYYHQDDWEEAAHSLGLLVGLPFQDSLHLKGLRDDPNQVKGRAFVVSRELVKAVRQDSPLVLLLEDLQWTDAASWDYLTEVYLDGSSALQSNGLFILGAARPEWHPPEILLNLLASSSSTVSTGNSLGTLISLSPLTNQSIQQLAQELLQRATNVPKEVIDLLVDRSEGVPYFTEEIVNWLIDHRILDTHEELWTFSPERLKEQPLPGTLQHLLLTRLSNLSQPERAALQRGAIFGRRFWTGGVEAMGVPAGAEMLAHLQPRGFVEAQPESAFQGDTEWSFHHNLLQEVTYESVLKRERAALHKVAAGWLELQARQANRLDEFAGLLGDHYEHAGELGTAADWYLRAGRRTFNQGAPHEAVNFYSQALELLPPVDKERRWLAMTGREEALAILGDAAPWKADTAALLELAHSFDDENYLAEAFLRRAICGMRAGDPIINEQACQEALHTARRCGNEAIEAKALALIAQNCIVHSDEPAATQNINDALLIARRLGDDRVLSFVLFRAAFCSPGDFSKANQYQIDQIELDHRLGNRAQEATGLNNLGANYLGIGMFKQARTTFEQARMINESLGARRALAYNLEGLGIIYLESGDLRKAHQLLEQALQEISPSQDIPGKISILGNIERVSLDMGDVDGAVRRLNESLQYASGQGMDARLFEIKAELAACAILQGRPEEARKHIYEAWGFIKDHGWVGMERPPRVYLVCAETFDVLGELDNFHMVIETAYREMLKVADIIDVPEERQSFLENVRDHRELMELCERNLH